MCHTSHTTEHSQLSIIVTDKLVLNYFKIKHKLRKNVNLMTNVNNTFLYDQSVLKTITTLDNDLYQKQCQLER